MIPTIERDYFRARFSNHNEVVSIDTRLGITEWQRSQEAEADGVLSMIDAMIEDLQDLKADMVDAMEAEIALQASTDEEGAAMVRQWRRDAGPGREIR